MREEEKKWMANAHAKVTRLESILRSQIGDSSERIPLSLQGQQACQHIVGFILLLLRT